MNILLIGGPGSGKGTLGKFLAENNGVHLSTGELFRFHMENDTEIGLEVKEIIKAGGLADDKITLDMMEEEVSKLYPTSEMVRRLNVEKEPTIDNSDVTLIFDGFPRTIDQVPMLDEMLDIFCRKLDIAIFLDVPDDVMMTRMQERARLENREGDDDPEYCKKRIEVYNVRTSPLLDLYRDRGILLTVDGTKSIEEVREHVSSILIQKEKK